MIELVDFNEIYGKGKGEVKEAAKKNTPWRWRKKGTETGKPELKTETVAATEASVCKRQKSGRIKMNHFFGYH